MNGRSSTVVVLLVAVLAAAGTVPTLAAPTPGGDLGVDRTGGDAAPLDGAGSGGSPGALGAQACEFPFEVTDATGTTVRIEEDPESVITLGASAAQTMKEIGAWDEVTGVTRFASYLEGASEKANVSAPGFRNYRVEKMVSMNPDVVLAANIIGNRTVEKLRSVGLTVVMFPKATSIEDVKRKTRRFGRIVGSCEGAADSVRWIEANARAVSNATEGREKPKVVYVTGTFTTGAETFVHDVITTAGGRNIMAEAGLTGFKPVDEEVVATENPSWVITTNPDSNLLSKSPYSSTTAGEEGNLLVVDANWMNQPAPRSVVYAMRNVTEALHPDAFGPEDYVSRSAAVNRSGGNGTATNGTTTATGDGGTGLPGFGVPVALAAVLAALALLARRRE